MDKLELQKLRDLPIEGVAERLGLRVERHKSLCPFHEDRHPSLSYRVSRNTYRCFVCGANGGPIDLVMRHLHVDFKEACRWLSNENNIILDEWKPAQIDEVQKPFDALKYEKYFMHPWLNEEARKFLFEERRIDPRVVRWCRLTSWKDKQGVPWLQIPYYNREGKLVGVQNRNLTPSKPLPNFANGDSLTFVGPKPHSVVSLNTPVARGEANKTPLLGGVGGGSAPRFRFPQGSQCGIYNLPVLNLLKPGDELYIAEGCSDCWSLLSAGHKAIAIPSATLLSKKDKELLQAIAGSKVQGVQDVQEDKNSSLFTLHSSLGTTFHMFPDRDEPGERLFLQLQKVLPSLVHHQLPPTCKDYSEYYLKAPSGSPFGGVEEC